MRTEDLTFAGSTGATLAGVLHRPDDTARGSILLAHCFTCGKDIHTMTRLADALAEAGYACLRFDFTGLGESGGDRRESTFVANVGDLVRAATTLIERGFGPCGLIGHSLGGAAALAASHRLHTVRSIATIGTPSDADHVRHLFADEVDEIAAEGCRVVDIGGRPFPVSQEFVDALDTDLRLAEVDRPLLVVHAPDDEVVPYAEARRLEQAVGGPVGLWPLLGADHLVTDRDCARDLAAVLVAWFDQTL